MLVSKLKLSQISNNKEQKKMTANSPSDKDGGYKTWSKNFNAAKFVEAYLQNGDIDITLRQKQVYKKYAVLCQNSLDSFHFGLNTIKTQVGCHVGNGAGKLNFILVPIVQF